MKCFARDCDAGCYLMPDETIRKYRENLSRILTLTYALKKITMSKFYGVVEVHGVHNCQLIKALEPDCEPLAIDRGQEELNLSPEILQLKN